MRVLSLGGRCLVAMALVALTAGCDGSEPKISTTPSSISAPSPGGSVTNLVITGPARMAPGQSAQFTINAPSSAIVRWISSPPSFLQINSSGLATAGPLSGGAAVAAEVTTGPGGSVKEVRQGVVVMPDGTYILSGTVYDAEFRSTPVLDAHVEVTPGPLVTEASGGYYRLYGVPPNAELRVTAEGYQPSVQSLTLSGNATQNIELTASGPRLNLAGAYTLTIDVTDGCTDSFPASLPAELQHRRYDAVLTQRGLTLDVALAEPRFRPDSTGRGRGFTGRVTTTGATFTLDGPGSGWDWLEVYPSVVERLSDGTFLIVAGDMVTTGSSAGLSGAMKYSEISNWDSSFPAYSSRLLGNCSGNLRFALTPR